MADPSFVTVTKQVPVEELINDPFLFSHPVASPSVTANDTAPVPEPPAALKMSGVPNVVLWLESEIEFWAKRLMMNVYCFVGAVA